MPTFGDFAMTMKTVFTAAALATLAFAGAASAATTYTFEGLPTIAPIANGYAGLSWHNIYVLNANTYSGNPSGYHNAIVSGDNVAFNAFASPGSFTSATPFSLVSFFLNAAWNDGVTVNLVGKLAGVTVHSTSFLVNTAGPVLHTFNWSNIDEVDLASSGGTHHAGYPGGGSHVALDNLTLSAGTPEPMAWTLMVLGMGAIGGALRTRTSRTASAES